MSEPIVTPKKETQPMSKTFTGEATCNPTAGALRDALAGIPDDARVTVTFTTDQRDGDYLTVRATWTPKLVGKFDPGGLIYPPGVRGVTQQWVEAER